MSVVTNRNDDVFHQSFVEATTVSFPSISNWFATHFASIRFKPAANFASLRVVNFIFLVFICWAKKMNQIRANRKRILLLLDKRASLSAPPDDSTGNFRLRMSQIEFNLTLKLNLTDH